MLSIFSKSEKEKPKGSSLNGKIFNFNVNKKNNKSDSKLEEKDERANMEIRNKIENSNEMLDFIRFYDKKENEDDFEDPHDRLEDYASKSSITDSALAADNSLKSDMKAKRELEKDMVYDLNEMLGEEDSLANAESTDDVLSFYNIEEPKEEKEVLNNVSNEDSKEIKFETKEEPEELDLEKEASIDFINEDADLNNNELEDKEDVEAIKISSEEPKEENLNIDTNDSDLSVFNLQHDDSLEEHVNSFNIEDLSNASDEHENKIDLSSEIKDEPVENNTVYTLNSENTGENLENVTLGNSVDNNGIVSEDVLKNMINSVLKDKLGDDLEDFIEKELNGNLQGFIEEEIKANIGEIMNKESSDLVDEINIPKKVQVPEEFEMPLNFANKNNLNQDLDNVEKSNNAKEYKNLEENINSNEDLKEEPTNNFDLQENSNLNNNEEYGLNSNNLEEEYDLYNNNDYYLDKAESILNRINNKVKEEKESLKESQSDQLNAQSYANIGYKLDSEIENPIEKAKSNDISKSNIDLTTLTLAEEFDVKEKIKLLIKNELTKIIRGAVSEDIENYKKEHFKRLNILKNDIKDDMKEIISETIPKDYFKEKQINKADIKEIVSSSLEEKFNDFIKNSFNEKYDELKETIKEFALNSDKDEYEKDNELLAEARRYKFDESKFSKNYDINKVLDLYDKGEDERKIFGMLKDIAIYSNDPKMYMTSYIALKDFFKDKMPSEFKNAVREIKIARLKERIDINKFVNSVKLEKREAKTVQQKTKKSYLEEKIESSIGKRLKENILDYQGNLLLVKGTIITKELIEKLNNIDKSLVFEVLANL